MSRATRLQDREALAALIGSPVIARREFRRDGRVVERVTFAGELSKVGAVADVCVIDHGYVALGSIVLADGMTMHTIVSGS